MVQRYKIFVYVPRADAEAVKQAAFEKGAGQIGLYNKVSFSFEGNSEFTPGPDAKPHIGQPGKKEQVDEIKLEMASEGEERTREVVKAIRATHPYEEVVVDVFKLEDF